MCTCSIGSKCWMLTTFPIAPDCMSSRIVTK
jgi:hypothetical protein